MFMYEREIHYNSIVNHIYIQHDEAHCNPTSNRPGHRSDNRSSRALQHEKQPYTRRPHMPPALVASLVTVLLLRLSHRREARGMRG